MKKVRILFGIIAGFSVATGIVSLTGSYAFADSNVGTDLAPFMSDLILKIETLGGLTWLAKIALILSLTVSSMKVSFLDDVVWNRLGPVFQPWVAPILGLIAGILSPLLSGGKITLLGALAYATAGAGAVFVHQILDGVKAIPGLGIVYVSLIAAIEKQLGGNPVNPNPVKPATA